MNDTFIIDVECFPNYFCCSAIPIGISLDIVNGYIEADMNGDAEYKRQWLIDNDCLQFGIYKGRNDLKALIAFITSTKMLIGFNSTKYDNLLLDFCDIKYSTFSRKSTNEITDELYHLSQEIINAQGMNIRYSHTAFKNYNHNYITLDLFSLVFESVERKSLKQTAINLKWYRIQDLPLPYDEMVDESMFEAIFDYNINDDLITHALFYNQLAIIKLRIELNALYSCNLLNANKSKMADILLAKFYSSATGLKYYDFKDLRSPRVSIQFGELISPIIGFTDPVLVDLHTRLKNTTFNMFKDKFKETLIFRGQAYTIATGGLHSQDRAGIHVSDDDYIIRDADVTSFYPFIVYKFRVAPAHLSEDAWHNIVGSIIVERVEAKANKFTTKAEGLKIVLNAGVFGKYGFENGWLYDPEALYKVTLNGQLLLLMLIEKFENADIHVISANTDGIVVKLPREKEGLYYQICDEWCKETSFALEFTDYTKYVYTSVNDYLAFKPDGKFKMKGDFVTDILLTKGYSMPIIAIAIFNYFKDGKSIDDTLKEHLNSSPDAILDFCISQKMGDQFIGEYHQLKNNNLTVTRQQKNIRYYISDKGGALIKKYKDKNKRISAVAGENVIIYNNHKPLEDTTQYYVKYSFYKAECMKMLHNISNMITNKMKKEAGNLFD